MPSCAVCSRFPFHRDRCHGAGRKTKTTLWERNMPEEVTSCWFPSSNHNTRLAQNTVAFPTRQDMSLRPLPGTGFRKPPSGGLPGCARRLSGCPETKFDLSTQLGWTIRLSRNEQMKNPTAGFLPQVGLFTKNLQMAEIHPLQQKLWMDLRHFVKMRIICNEMILKH